MRFGRRLLFGGTAAAMLLAALPGAAAAADAGAIDTGDTAWLLIATALVMVMLPGLALFYGGLVRRKNVLSTIMHSFFGLALVSVVWVVVGFSLAFGTDVGGLGLIGDLDYVGFITRRPHAQRDLRPDHPVHPVRGLPADVRGHHPGPDHRGLRRAQAVRRVRPVHDPLVGARLLPRRPLGLVRRTAGCTSSVPWTSPAAPSSTPRRACRPSSSRSSSGAGRSTATAWSPTTSR